MPSIPITQATNTTATLIAGAVGQIIRVTGYTLTDDTAFGTVQFKSGIAALTGALILDKGTPFSVYNSDGLFDTELGAALNLITASGAVTGSLQYFLLTAPQYNSDGTLATKLQGTLDFSLSYDSMFLAVV